MGSNISARSRVLAAAIDDHQHTSHTHTYAHGRNESEIVEQLVRARSSRPTLVGRNTARERTVLRCVEASRGHSSFVCLVRVWLVTVVCGFWV